MGDKTPTHGSCEKCNDRRSATSVQLEIANQMSGIRVLLQKHTDHMEGMGERLGDLTVWAEGDHKTPGAKFYVAKWVARDRRLNQVKLLAIAGLATAAATQYVPGLAEWIDKWALF